MKKKLQKKPLDLNFIWKQRCYLWNKGSKLLDASNKLLAEGGMLQKEAQKFWVDAVSEVYGDIKIDWGNWSDEKQDCECHLGNGEIFKP